MDTASWEAIFIGLTALVTAGGYIHLRAKALDDRMADQHRHLQGEISNLASNCVRRDEIKDIITPMRHDISEIRHRLDDLFKGKT